MSKEIDDIRRKFQSSFNGDGDAIFPAVVTEVNEDEFTCTVQRDEQVDYFDVRLRGLVKAELQGFAFIPKLESIVLVARIGKSNELFVCQFTEIDKVIFTDNDLELKIDLENIDIKKGEKITIHVDAEKLEVVNDKTKVTHEAEALTLLSDQATIKITTGGLTLKKGGSGLKKTLDKMLDGICQLTVPTALGPSGVPINLATFQQIKADLPNYLEG
nr:MAG TPA: baseplate protein [Caudoviricetes sp.]